ncbi:MAG: exonuclease SbcCD subunit D [Christensenellaceae bacterium]|nr:exonuclease SbcCD subunit D [Christensenellaceae bacterium]
MKFIHIADLHLGKRLNDVSMLEDQAHILRQITEIAKEEKADAVLIAGDVYQKASPPAEAMSLFNEFLTELTAHGMKTFVISGNHDSDMRISYLSSLVRRSGVYISEKFEGKLQQYTFTDAFGEITISLLPFIRPQLVRRFYPEEKIESYTDAVRVVFEHSAINPAKRNIILAHQFITGAETSDSEEFAVGGLDNIEASVFEGFDYVALGHIHKPQRAGAEMIRYAGSPLKYSFSEVNHQKSVTVIEIKEKGSCDLRLVPLEPLHDMREVSGSMQEIMAMPYSEDYMRVVVTDEEVSPDARVTVSTVFPNMMSFGVQNSKTKTDIDVLAKESIEDKSIAELFCDFFRLQNNDVEPGEAQMKVFYEVLQKLEDEGYEAD